MLRLYVVSKHYSGGNHFLLPVPEDEIHYARSHIIQPEEANIFQEYFSYVFQFCNLDKPTDWREALELYNTLLQHAHGN